ncbi:VOC family protein [uncultured Roseobacter sp.]|uniref:VOC family protein n=1 Tax=uncultured Roseobacter sp. TaxID=114847 RepID=UPI0026120F0C|nr:VOC family protein [uncultured Roseobacter sp.]
MVPDHLAVSGETLEEATAFAEDALGIRMQPGGEHDVFFTHNTLLGLCDGLYLEAIAINPAAPSPGRPRWFDLDTFSGPARLTNWICRTDDMVAELKDLPAGMGDIVHLSRGDLRWMMAVPESGRLPFDNCAPALIQWQTARHPAQRLTPSGVRLRRLTVMHPQADDLRLMLQNSLADDRIAIETGAQGLLAEFDTPAGARVLGQ